MSEPAFLDEPQPPSVADLVEQWRTEARTAQAKGNIERAAAISQDATELENRLRESVRRIQEHHYVRTGQWPMKRVSIDAVRDELRVE